MHQRRDIKQIQLISQVMYQEISGIFLLWSIISQSMDGLCDKKIKKAENILIAFKK